MNNLICPQCENTLVQEGKPTEATQYNFRLYLNHCDNVFEGGKYSLVECLVCNHIAKSTGFENE